MILTSWYFNYLDMNLIMRQTKKWSVASRVSVQEKYILMERMSFELDSTIQTIEYLVSHMM